MKKQIIKIALGLFPVLGFSQVVVHDPVQEANMSAQISNSTQQITQMEKSLEYMKKASEKLDKVSMHIRSLKDLDDIKDLYKESFKLAQKVRGNIHRFKRPIRQKQVIDDVANIVSDLSQSLKFVSQVLSNDFFKMTDKERLELIKEEKRKLLMKRARLLTYTD